MKLSRREAVAAFAATPGVAVPADAIPDARAKLLDDAVTRLSWMFPQPSSGNTQIGFGMRKGQARRHLADYLNLYEVWFQRLPEPEHLYAAGTAITSRPFWFQPPKGHEFRVTEENFSDLWLIAHRRLSAVPALREGDIFPARAEPPKRRRIRVRAGAEVIEEVSLEADPRFEDLVWLYGSPWMVLQHAIAHLWADAAFLRAGGSVELDEVGRAPEPEAAWRMVKLKSELRRRAWAREKALRDVDK